VCPCHGEAGVPSGRGHCGGLGLPERLRVERLLSDERRLVYAAPRSEPGTLLSQPERCRSSGPKQWQPTSERWVSTAGRAATIRPTACLCSQREFRGRKHRRAIYRPIRRPLVSAAAHGEAPRPHFRNGLDLRQRRSIACHWRRSSERTVFWIHSSVTLSSAASASGPAVRPAADGRDT
jgi:hypothetical protein